MTGSTGDDGVPPASIASPASRQRSSRKRPETTCTPTGTRPTNPVVTASPGNPMKGMAICVNCARHTRANDASSLRSSPSGNGNSPDTGISSTGYFSRNNSHSRDNVARRVKVFENAAASNGNDLGLVAAQARERAGIAFALGGIELRFIVVAEPQPGLQLSGLPQRRRGLDLLDRPARALQPLAGIGQRRLHLGNGLKPVRVETQRGALRHRGPFERRRHPPGIAHVARRHRRKRDPQIADGARQRTGDRADLRADGALGHRGIEGGDAADRRPQPMNAAGIGGIADRARDIGAVRDMADAGRDRGRRAAGRAARRDDGSRGFLVSPWIRLVVNQR